MKKKITVIVAVILCLAFALCGCGTANTKFTPEVKTRKITQAVNMAEGLENATGGMIKRLSPTTNTFAPLYVVEGTQTAGDKRRETRVFSYSSGETVLSLADTAANKYNVRILDNDSALYVYTEPTDVELDLGQGDSNHVYTHYAAIYSRTGKLIAEKEKKVAYRHNPITISELIEDYDITGGGSERRFFFRTYNDDVWELNDKNDFDLIATKVPFYNDPVYYTCKANGYYYAVDDATITVYDSVFNKVSVYNAPIYMASGDGASVYMLNNGNAIVQTPVAVPDSEKNYDVSMVSDNVVVKLRLVTYLVNPLKGTQKKIKFNYLLANVYTRATAPDMFDAYAAGVENIGFGFKPQDKSIDFNNNEIFVIGNNGKVGDSLKLVGNQSKNLLYTVDGNYFTITDDDGYVHVYNKKLKEVKSYPKNAIGSFKKAGPYLIDATEQIIYDYALNEIYRSPKDEEGSFTEDFFITTIGKYDYRIATVSKVNDTTAAFNEFRDGKIKQIFTFTEDGDETLEMEDGAYAYRGYYNGGQFYCTHKTSTGKYYYYNFDGVLLCETATALSGNSVVGGCSVMIDATNGVYMLFK